MYVALRRAAQTARRRTFYCLQWQHAPETARLPGWNRHTGKRAEAPAPSWLYCHAVQTIRPLPLAGQPDPASHLWSTAHDGPHGQAVHPLAQIHKKGESPHGPPLNMSGELFMDCEPATHPFMSRKSDAFRLTLALQCYTACPGCVFSGSAASRPQGQKTPVYCCGPSGSFCTKAKAISADDIRGRCAGFCSCCRTNPAMSIAIPASVIAERLAFLLSSSTARYRCIRARSCSS